MGKEWRCSGTCGSVKSRWHLSPPQHCTTMATNSSGNALSSPPSKHQCISPIRCSVAGVVVNKSTRCRVQFCGCQYMAMLLTMFFRLVPRGNMKCRVSLSALSSQPHPPPQVLKHITSIKRSESRKYLHSISCAARPRSPKSKDPSICSSTSTSSPSSTFTSVLPR